MVFALQLCWMLPNAISAHFLVVKLKHLESTVLCEDFYVLVNAQECSKRKNQYSCWCFRMVLGLLSRYQVHKANRFQAKRRKRPSCMWTAGVSDSPCGCCWLAGVESLVFWRLLVAAHCWAPIKLSRNKCLPSRKHMDLRNLTANAMTQKNLYL